MKTLKSIGTCIIICFFLISSCDEVTLLSEDEFYGTTTTSDSESSGESSLTVSITSTASSVTNIGPIPLTITFSEDVTGFANTDLTISNGTAGTLNAASPSVYTVDITPTTDGTVTVNITAAVCTSLDASKNNQAASQFSITYDTTGPLVNTITPATGSLVTDTGNIVLRFDSPMNNTVFGTLSFTSPSLTFTNGTNCTMTFSTTSLTNDTVTIDPDSSFTDYSYTDITVSGFEDSAGNTMSSYNLPAYTFSVKKMIINYTLDGSINDSSGFGNNGTGSVSYVNDRHGNANSAADPMPQIVSANVLGFSGAHPRSVALWIKSDVYRADLGTSAFNYVFSHGTNAAGQMFSATYKGNNDLLLYDFFDGGTNYTTSAHLTNVWEHWVFTYDGTTAYCYRNGALVGSSTFTLNTPDDKIYIAALDPDLAGGFYFDGFVDEVKVYNYALTSAEAAAIFTAEYPQTPQPEHKGELIPTNHTPTSCTLTWEKAVDYQSSQSALEYRVVKSTDPTLIDTIAKVEAVSGGDLVVDWTADISSAVITGLTAQTYYYNVLVRDPDGNRALYAYSIDPTRDGLVAYYPFNGNYIDESGNNLNLTNYSASLYTDRYGIGSRAYDFFPGQYMTAAHNVIFNFTSQLTVSAWVNLDNPGNDQKIVGKCDAGGAKGFLMGVNGTDAHFEFWDSTNTLYSLASSPASLITAGNWHHIAVTFQAGVALKIYIDGQLRGTNSSIGTNNLYTNINVLTIAQCPWGVPGVFPVDGRIDDIRLFNKTLTDAEIVSIYLMEKP